MVKISKFAFRLKCPISFGSMLKRSKFWRFFVSVVPFLNVFFLKTGIMGMSVCMKIVKKCLKSYKSVRLQNLNPHSCKKTFLTKKDGQKRYYGNESLGLAWDWIRVRWVALFYITNWILLPVYKLSPEYTQPENVCYIVLSW